MPKNKLSIKLQTICPLTDLLICLMTNWSYQNSNFHEIIVQSGYPHCDAIWKLFIWHKLLYIVRRLAAFRMVQFLRNWNPKNVYEYVFLYYAVILSLIWMKSSIWKFCSDTHKLVVRQIGNSDKGLIICALTDNLSFGIFLRPDKSNILSFPNDYVLQLVLIITGILKLDLFISQPFHRNDFDQFPTKHNLSIRLINITIKKC